MLSIDRSEEVFGGRQAVRGCGHSLKMTLSEKGGRSIEKVLSKGAEIVDISLTLGAGEAIVSGGILISAVCFVAGGGVSCMEYFGKFEFSHRVDGIFPPCESEVRGVVSAVRVLRVSGSDLVCEVDFVAEEYFSAVVSAGGVESVDGCFSEISKHKIGSAVLKTHEFVASEEVEVFDGISAVLGSTFSAEILAVAKRRESVVVSGNLHGWFVFVNLDGKIARKELSFPFREEFSVADAGEFACRAVVGKCKVICEVNEVRKVSIATVEAEVLLSCWGYSESEFQVGGNFFSTDCELNVEKTTLQTSKFCGSVQTQNRFAFSAVSEFGEDCELGILNARVAQIARRDGDVGAGFAGEIAVCVFACEAGGEVKSREFAVPFRVDFQASGIAEKDVWCDVILSEIDVRLNGENVEIFGTVVACGIAFAVVETQIAVSVSEGDAKAVKSCGFVLYRASEGESLLDVARAINVMPDAIAKQNPRIAFPTAEGAKIVVFA